MTKTSCLRSLGVLSLLSACAPPAGTDTALDSGVGTAAETHGTDSSAVGALSRSRLTGVRLRDFNNDGYDDLVVASPYEGYGTKTAAGIVQVLLGGATGPSNDDEDYFESDLGETTESNDWFGASVATGDINGDGYADLITGAPYEDPTTTYTNPGAFFVAFGSSGDLGAAGTQFIHEGIDYVEGTPASSEYLGWAVTVGDFNGDGYGDVAAGAYNDTESGVSGGAVLVMHGGGAGLSTANDQIWTQKSSGIQGTASATDDFGYAVASGDFNDDGFDDLVIGVPGESEGGAAGAGGVNVINGSAGGLAYSGNYLWYGSTASGLYDTSEADDNFGKVLAVGDFDCDGTDDLAVGSPGEDYNSKSNTGAVHVIYGSSGGLSTSGDQFLTQDTGGATGIEDACGDDDAFGSALAAGDFDGDGCDDLAIGAPKEDGSAVHMGIVHVLFGTPTGLDTTNDQTFWQADLGRTSDGEDRFGQSLGAGDFDADGYVDLVVSVYGEQVTSAASAGAVHVIHGSSAGLSLVDDRQYLTQDTSGIKDAAEANDHWGYALP